MDEQKPIVGNPELAKSVRDRLRVVDVGDAETPPAVEEPRQGVVTSAEPQLTQTQLVPAPTGITISWPAAVILLGGALAAGVWFMSSKTNQPAFDDFEEVDGLDEDVIEESKIARKQGKSGK